MSVLPRNARSPASHSDMSARYVELDSSPVSGTVLDRTFTLPDDKVAPTGYYMMFALSSGGIPSVAIWIRV